MTKNTYPASEWPKWVSTGVGLMRKNSNTPLDGVYFGLDEYSQAASDYRWWDNPTFIGAHEITEAEAAKWLRAKGHTKVADELERKLPPDTRSDLRVYLAGPMTGIPDFNFPAFNAAEAELLKHYKTVFNPARNFDGKTDLPRKDYMRKDFEALLQSDVIAVLPGWSKSSGAKAEVAVAAQLDLKAILMPGCRLHNKVPEIMRTWSVTEDSVEKDIITDTSMQSSPSTHETILQEAQRLVGGDRGSDYGHPLDDYNKTGMIWGALLHKWAKLAAQSDVPLPVPADLACLMMVGVKLSRHVNKRKRDNLVDAAGYLRCTEMCEDEQERRNNTEKNNG